VSPPLQHAAQVPEQSSPPRSTHTRWPPHSPEPDKHTLEHRIPSILKLSPGCDTQPVQVLVPTADSQSTPYAYQSESLPMMAVPSRAAVDDREDFVLPEPADYHQRQSPPTIAPPTSPPPSTPTAAAKRPGKLTKEQPLSWTPRKDSLVQGPSPPPSEESLPTEGSSRLQHSQHSYGSGPSSRSSEMSDVQTPSQRGGITPPPTEPKQAQSQANRSPLKKVEKLRRNLLPGTKSPANTTDLGHPTADAWVFSPDNSKAEYNLTFLTGSERVGHSFHCHEISSVL
jgi:hypothetical protein